MGENEEMDPYDVDASTSFGTVSTTLDQTGITKALEEESSQPSISKLSTLRLKLKSLRALNFTKSFKSAVSLKSPRSCSPNVLESRFKTCASLKRVDTPHALVFQSPDELAISRAISSALSTKARANRDGESVEPVVSVDSKVVGGSTSSNGTSKVTSNAEGDLMDVDDQSVEQSTFELSTLWHVIVSCIICIVLAGPAIVVDEIADVFRVLGSTSNPISGYILPTCFVLLLVPPGDMRKIKGLAVLMSMVVSVVSVSALYQQVRDLAVN